MNGTGHGYPPPAAHPAYGPAPKAAGNGFRFKVGAVVAAVAVGLAGGAVWAGLAPVPASSAQPEALYMENASVVGDNPFVPDSASTDVSPAQPATPVGANVQLAAAAAPASAGSNNLQTVDPAKLSAFLVANPGPAKVWTDALNSDTTLRWSGGNHVSPAQIPAYIKELSPSVLSQDLRVTNHGFDHGVLTTMQSVLQRGTAVLVDRYGVVRVRGKCGNPLTPQVLYLAAPTRYIGRTWVGFEPSIVHIRHRDDHDDSDHRDHHDDSDHRDHDDNDSDCHHDCKPPCPQSCIPGCNHADCKQPGPDPVKYPEPAPVPDPVKDPAPAPVKDPVQDPAPVPVPDPVKDPVKDPAPVPVPDPVKDPAPVPDPDPFQQPKFAPVPNPEPVPNPTTPVEPKIAQVDKSAAQDGDAETPAIEGAAAGEATELPQGTEGKHSKGSSEKSSHGSDAESSDTGSDSSGEKSSDSSGEKAGKHSSGSDDGGSSSGKSKDD